MHIFVLQTIIIWCDFCLTVPESLRVVLVNHTSQKSHWCLVKCPASYSEQHSTLVLCQPPPRKTEFNSFYSCYNERTARLIQITAIPHPLPSQYKIWYKKPPILLHDKSHYSSRLQRRHTISELTRSGDGKGGLEGFLCSIQKIDVVYFCTKSAAVDLSLNDQSQKL